MLSTRDYSSEQERYIAKITGGKLTPNSGGTKFCPNCGMIIDTESVSDIHYCSNCGQRIDVTKTTIDRLFGVKNINTGEIIFNARGGAYHTYDAALKKRERLGEDDYMVVTYKLSNNN